MIVVDDKVENLKNIEMSLQEFNPEIKFIGLHYTRIQEIESQVLDANVVKEAWETWVTKTQQICGNAKGGT